MSEEFWTKITDHLIQAVVTIILAAIPAYFAFRSNAKKLQENTDQTIKAKNAAIGAAKTGKEIQTSANNKEGGSSTVNVETVNVEVNPDPK
jgi:hypothetical protein